MRANKLRLAVFAGWKWMCRLVRAPQMSRRSGTDDQSGAEVAESKTPLTEGSDQTPTSTPSRKREDSLAGVPSTSSSSPSPSDGESTTDDASETDGGDRRPDTGRRTPPERAKVEPKPPRDIGGRRGRPTATERPDSDDTQGGPTSARPEFRPELICRKLRGSLRWDVFLAADDESRIAAVKQNGEPLSPSAEGWRLPSFAGRLSVETKEGRSISVSLSDAGPLIFKLNQDWRGVGRKITRLTKGHFIVIAPADWARSGHVPVEPEHCFDSTFLAHYFFRDGSEASEDLGGFAGGEIDSSAPGLELNGDRVFDDSDDGALFIGRPPRLTPTNRVVWARVGEEATDGWSGCNFKPSETTLEEVLKGRQGRFFVRVYDEQGAMLDGTQFRYLGGLRQIRVNGEPYSEDTLLVPTAKGHPSTTVQFSGVDGLRVHATPPCSAAPLANEMSGLIAEPHPDADEILCAVEADGGRAEVTVHLPRFWWRLEGGGVEGDGEWRSTPFEMTRHGFRERAESKALLWLRLPKRITSVFVGFDDDQGRKYTRNDGEVAFPLAHFVDYSQIDQRLTEDALFNVRFGRPGDRIRDRLTLVRVRADTPPAIASLTCEPEVVGAGQECRLSWVIRNADDDVRIEIHPDIGAVESTGSHQITPSETTTYTLRLTAPGMEDIERRVTVRVRREDQQTGSGQPSPAVSGTGAARPVAKVKRGGGGWRPGKGFSRREVCASGQWAGKFRLKRAVWSEDKVRLSEGTIVDLSMLYEVRGRRVARLSYRGRHVITCTVEDLKRYGRKLQSSSTEAARRSISVDTRRRSEHPTNVEILRRMTDD